MPYLDLSDDEADALLIRTIDGEHYPLSPRVQTLRAILDKLRPEPVRQPPLELKVYASPRFIRGRQRV
jgi:hypothetical protein